MGGCISTDNRYSAQENMMEEEAATNAIAPNNSAQKPHIMTEEEKQMAAAMAASLQSYHQSVPAPNVMPLNPNFVMEFIFNEDYVSVLNNRSNQYMRSNVNAYSDYRSNRNVQYTVAFRQSKIGVQSVCCQGIGRTVLVNDTSKLRILLIKTPLKNAFNVELVESNCLKNHWFKNNGHFFGIGLIGIRKSAATRNNPGMKIEQAIEQLWKKVYRFIKSIDDSCGLLALLKEPKYVNQLKQLGIDVSKNDLTILACAFSHFHNLFDYYKTYMFENRNETCIYDSSDRLAGIQSNYDEKYCAKVGDTITLRLNRPKSGYNTISFVKNDEPVSSHIIGNKYLGINLRDYYYQYMVVSKSCDCSERGNFKVAVSYS